jgi:hypothetical protein
MSDKCPTGRLMMRFVLNKLEATLLEEHEILLGHLGWPEKLMRRFISLQAAIINDRYPRMYVAAKMSHVCEGKLHGGVLLRVSTHT